MKNTEDTTGKYTKQYETRQYTEITYYRDGEEFARENMNDDFSYSATSVEPMTEEEIEDWA
jgi:hypothetical protein